MLDIAYLDSGSHGTAVLLLHGWPDDVSAWQDVAPVLNAAGFRTIMPSLRGFGATRFLTADAPRTGNSAILAMDAIALMDGLGIERFAVAGHDWGSNIAEALAIGWPQRVSCMALLSSPPRMGGVQTPPFWHAQLLWYQWFMATDRGARAMRNDPKGFARLMWQNWSPKGWFDDALFERVASAFENPDWVDVTLHSYRARWGGAPEDPRSAELGELIKATRSVPLPTIYIQGGADGVNPPAVSENVAAKFTGPFRRIVLDGVGHFPAHEAPGAVAALLCELLFENSAASE